MLNRNFCSVLLFLKFDSKIKSLFTVCVLFILLNACDNSGRVENKLSNATNFLHDIAQFTSDSLVHVVIEIAAGSNQKWEVDKI